MKISSGIQALKDSGLNIFLSIKVCDLPEDIFPFSDEQKTKTLCLIGNGGKSLWENLPHPIDVKTNPIDFFTQNKMQEFAKNSLNDEIEILYPNDSYTMPLQKIGRAMNLCTQSPIGIDIHPEFGLWFAFRGIFLTSEEMPIFKMEKSPAPCDSCSKKTCLNSSDVHISRLSCPINQHQYTSFQIDYHQNALKLIKV